MENIASGQSAVFSVKASGTDVKYSWYHQKIAGKTMLSEKTSTLTIENVQLSHEGDYLCKITNPTGGFVETKPAQLILGNLLSFCSCTLCDYTKPLLYVPKNHFFKGVCELY